MNALSKPETGGILSLALIIAILPFFLPNSFYFDVVILVGINAIVCVGLNLLIGYAGQISLGHAGFFGLGAYFSGILVSNHGWSPIVALISGALFVGLLAYILARPVMKLRGHYLAMGTLGMGIVISIVLNQEGDLTGGPDGMPVAGFSIFGWEPGNELTWYWMVSGLLLIAVWMALNLINSPVGRALRAVHGSEVAASVAGVDVARYKSLVFVVSAVFASIAGSLYAHYSGFLTPSEADFFHSIELVTMVVLGGMASVFGAVVGAAVLTLLPQLLTVFHDYEMLVFGAAMMITMIFMRRGLVPTLQSAFNRWRK
ncbi:MAG: branched-chain amino acid ABC transporter permease [Rhodospirillaceae bacterium]|jgi:branched-chain amino acid transport system permease protein|nr:branched-chain amino acid ABC transporter permease [Rhodospirillaceae bacterium]MBT5242730.1 branched-chain amino acid ABC transporter permease [Rhodospirillaceae bacterium]MBT5561543.1 branched-chain amino acid ABC transporter permease [Rhodospirillaceae bacterium]MBT6241859.1 branched-chain amino acid ABC transporter permease [Rhodospirillaceae bacterium]MBT7138660.1 branched-chain amino acid ABC transporter permease [Rhodospirillaceae bacterium]